MGIMRADLGQRPARSLIAAGEADVEASVRNTRSAIQRTPLRTVPAKLRCDDNPAVALAARMPLRKHPRAHCPVIGCGDRPFPDRLFPARHGPGLT